MTRTISIKKILGPLLFIGLFVFIVSYALFQTKAISKGVSLNILNIKDGDIFYGEILKLSGSAQHATHLAINDREIAIDDENGFSEELVLSEGYNIITVEAKDKFDKETMKVYRVLYEAPAPTMDVATLPAN